MLNLVIQGLEIDTSDLKALAKLTHAAAIERITATAFRLRNVKPAADVEAICERARLDHAYVPGGRRLSDFGLVVMDMDSTLITIECIDEIADMHGIKPEVAAITESCHARRNRLHRKPETASCSCSRGSMSEHSTKSIANACSSTPGAETMIDAMRSAGCAHSSFPAASVTSPHA